MYTQLQAYNLKFGGEKNQNYEMQSHSLSVYNLQLRDINLQL